jgi:hypothetical protein
VQFSRKPEAKKQVHIHPQQSKLVIPQTMPPVMIRTTSKPKSPPLPDIDSINPQTSIPGILPHPNLLRPKARKPESPSPPQYALQVPGGNRRKGNNVPRPRRRAHSRVSNSGWLTDEIVGGQVDDFNFEENLGKFDKRGDWETFRVCLPEYSQG